MTDLLLELSRRPRARRLLAALPLPLPMPEPLRRSRHAMTAVELRGRRVVLAGAGALEQPLRSALMSAGAERLSDEALDADALVFDATGLHDPSELTALYEFFHPRLRRLRAHGRALVVGRPKQAPESPTEAATRWALEGFVRSLAKELGRRAATATLLTVAPSAEANLAPVLRFLLSDRAAFVSGQRLDVSVDAGRLSDRDAQGGARPLSGKRALVTGAARGIGLAIARKLTAEGARVTLLDRPSEQERLDALARELSGLALGLDLAEPRAAAEIVESFPEGVDAVIHNAGVTRDRTLARMSEDSWKLCLDVNLDAPLRVTRALLDVGRLRAGGRLLFLSSVAGIAGNVGQTNYAASKAGLLGLVQAWSAELASEGITVNALAPGFIETDMTAAMPWAIRQAARRLSALGQGGLPDDVAEAALFFSLPEARGLTGQVLRVCGGALVGA